MGGTLCFLWEDLSVSYGRNSQFPGKKQPLYLFRICQLPLILITYSTCCGGGDILLLPLPVPIFDLVHNAHVIISCRRTAVYPNSILPSNCITNKENRYYKYLTAYYPLSLLPINKFSLHVENYGPKYMVLFYCNPQGTQMWWPNFKFQASPLDSDLRELFVYQFLDFLASFAAFSSFKFCGFVVLIFSDL